MFDYVKVEPEQKCYKCGYVLGGWQTKNLDCALKEVPFWMCNSFYTTCYMCGTWHKYTLNSIERTLSDYSLFVEMKLEKKP